MIDPGYRRVLKGTPTPRGYINVGIRVGSSSRPIGVHVLVADAFLGPKPFTTAQVRHLDGDTANNCASNLAWGTATENAADRLRHGRYARGAKHPGAKLTEEQVRSLLVRRADGEKVRDLAAAYSVSVSTIEAIIYGKQWKHITFKRLP